MASRPFDFARDIVLNAAGLGTVFLQVPFGELWTLERVALACSVTDPMPEFTLYRSTVSPGRRIGHSYNGGAAIAQGSDVFMPGDQIVGQWTGGLSGAKATATFAGTAQIRGI